MTTRAAAAGVLTIKKAGGAIEKSLAFSADAGVITEYNAGSIILVGLAALATLPMGGVTTASIIHARGKDITVTTVDKAFTMELTGGAGAIVVPPCTEFLYVASANAAVTAIRVQPGATTMALEYTIGG